MKRQCNFSNLRSYDRSEGQRTSSKNFGRTDHRFGGDRTRKRAIELGEQSVAVSRRLGNPDMLILGLN